MDYDIDKDALRRGRRKEDIDPNQLVYKPLYAITGYESACDKWIAGTSGPGVTFHSKISQFSHSDWTELGYSKTVSQRSNSFWWFFSRTSSSTSETETLNFSGSDWKSETEFTITTEGSVLSFQVTPGIW